MTTFYNYGSVGLPRQGEIIKALSLSDGATVSGADEIALAVLQAIRKDGLLVARE